MFCVMDQQTQCDKLSGGVTYGFTFQYTGCSLQILKCGTAVYGLEPIKEVYVGNKINSTGNICPQFIRSKPDQMLLARDTRVEEVCQADSGLSSLQDLSLPLSSCIPSREDEAAYAHLLMCDGTALLEDTQNSGSPARVVSCPTHTCCHSPVFPLTWGVAKLLFKLIYGESSSCAGRALRNIFTLQASDLIKDRVYLTGICRRSCVGSELVDWLLEQCPFVKCRSTAVGVWQLLLDMGIILSVDRQVYFQDSHAFYQFSADECTYLFCEFEKEEAWKNGVKLLLQLLPLSPPRIDMCNLPDQKIEDTAETNAEILARLTSAVQRELAAVIALKARKSAIHQNEENSSQEIRGLEELKDTSDAQAGVLCKLQGRDDIGRIELVQKLARENCQFLQADRKALEKAEQGREI
ncbi:Rap guanine nucleotide exchange factor 5 [Lamprotornis superbus]|uniref:Rap guanine nucleotide exchange factor 5 n=1 Tax=Lamprotornis superbus TaxID=245042 RepID=A0A835P0Z1_9PASS|nr:Rap guanine nucleotide exchange factor 5 [Lamprotornis superbus]